MNTRRFKMLNPLTLPLELHAGPGAEHWRAKPGEEIEIDAERCRLFDRYLRGRIRAKDMAEIDTPSTPRRDDR